MDTSHIMKPVEEVSMSKVASRTFQANKSVICQPLKAPEIDHDGYATCPDCGMRVNCGTVGISNLTKRHRGTKKCLELKMRRDKKGKGSIQRSLLTFMKPKPTLVPPMVTGNSLIQSSIIRSDSILPASLREDKDDELDDYSQLEAHSSLVSLESGPINGGSQFIKKLEALVKQIPESIPEGSENDRLAPFSDDPRNQDVSDLEGDELWEAKLNHFLSKQLTPQY
jgi:hypothetical protein